MANRHFGNLGDVWKHLVLAEVLAIERPLHYWETHAGSASYPLSPSRARGYGVYGFREASRHDRVLAESHYCRVLEGEVDRSVPMYPGSPLIAMRLLLSDTDYVFCDLDPASTDSLESAADGLGIDGRARCLTQDGLATIRDTSDAYAGDPADVLVHVDPFDPTAEIEPGLSAITLASELSRQGFKLIYWYGYGTLEERAWAWDMVGSQLGSRWCGDLTTRSNALGGRHTPIADHGPMIGCGVLAANVPPATRHRLARLGTHLAATYGKLDTPAASARLALDFLELPPGPSEAPQEES
jgi:23S rRNA (adenine2030-N6)-methyltransferase